MVIKSKRELTELRKLYKPIIDLREKGLGKNKNIEILIGMATCGIASGAKDTYNELKTIIEQKKMTHVKLIQVGCIGYCYMEPTIQVCIPGKEPDLYGKITYDKAQEFIDEVIIKQTYLKNNLLIKSFKKYGASI
ncbi:MAG: hypothetical protein B6I17_03475 [Tenericutes bacterium 4572_104]|nr:MAG: hypothetical protein B6I17_03475 [Tenericutes bacterium 4572_104]